jgi:hypothetical protein
VHISEIKEDGKWVSLRVKVIQLWDSTSDKITEIEGVDRKPFYSNHH